jgi:hypothetical protein
MVAVAIASTASSGRADDVRDSDAERDASRHANFMEDDAPVLEFTRTTTIW